MHVSALADKFVEDPHDVVNPGDIVKVKVLEVDQARKRISLTMRMDDRHQERQAGQSQGAPAGKGRRGGGQGQRQRGGGNKPAAAPQGALGAAFAKALEQQKKRG